jgi:hypothetical protein
MPLWRFSDPAGPGGADAGRFSGGPRSAAEPLHVRIVPRASVVFRNGHDLPEPQLQLGWQRNFGDGGVICLWPGVCFYLLPTAIPAGCGTYVPDIKEIPGKPGEGEPLVNAIVRNIHCELKVSAGERVDCGGSGFLDSGIS